MIAYGQISEARESAKRSDRAKSDGGDMPISRKCFGGMHDRCQGFWTQYPEDTGPCECECHS
jgi:hypothetical protein